MAAGLGSLELADLELAWERSGPNCPSPEESVLKDFDFDFGAATGKVVFAYDTLRDFDTVNGVPGKDGSVDAHSLFAGAGMVFVGSGYASFGQAAGNVLLAFRPRQPSR